MVLNRHDSLRIKRRIEDDGTKEGREDGKKGRRNIDKGNYVRKERGKKREKKKG